MGFALDLFSGLCRKQDRTLWLFAVACYERIVTEDMSRTEARKKRERLSGTWQEVMIFG